MSKKDEALKLALEALENAEYGNYDKKELNEAITAIREALAEQSAQQQEPEYAWPTVADYERDVGFQTNEAFRIAWNTARTTNRMLGHASSQPAQRTWVGLNDTDLAICGSEDEVSWARYWERVCREKNT